jgi:hypothetical protein
MCLDPVSLGLTLGGTALSAFGSMSQSKAASEAAMKQQAAENAVLNQVMNKEADFQGANTATMKDLVSKFAPDVQTANLASAEGNRDGLIDSAITNPNTNVTSGPNTPQFVKDQIASRMLDGVQFAKNAAKANAKVGAYGDSMGTNARNISDASGTIDMTNNFAKGWQSILPDQQQLAGASVYTPPSQTGGLLTGIGNLMAGLGGSGKAANFKMPSFNPGGMFFQS